MKIFYQQYVQGRTTVYPVKSLVSNTGYDGSGIHCGASDRFDVQRWDADTYTWTLPDRPSMPPEIVRAHARFWSGGPWRKLRHLKKFIRRL